MTDGPRRLMSVVVTRDKASRLPAVLFAAAALALVAVFVFVAGFGPKTGDTAASVGPGGGQSAGSTAIASVDPNVCASLGTPTGPDAWASPTSVASAKQSAAASRIAQSIPVTVVADVQGCEPGSGWPRAASGTD